MIFRSAGRLGKARRLRRLFSASSRRTIIVPLDDGLIFGPFNGLENLKHITGQLKGSAANAVLAFPGALRAQADDLQNLGWIINVSASTVRGSHTNKILVGAVEQAARLSADAVAVHVNVTDEHEGDMLRNLGQVVRECEALELPVVAIMYPRRRGIDEDDNYEKLKNDDAPEYARLIAHACRIGVELGADLIKTQYSGNQATFRTVVEAASGVPIVIAGGPLLERGLAIERARDAIAAGAIGVSFGRNVYQRKDIRKFLEDLSAACILSQLNPESSVLGRS